MDGRYAEPIGWGGGGGKCNLTIFPIISQCELSVAMATKPIGRLLF